VGLVVPLGMLLSLVSRRMAAGSAIYAWLYLNNWDWGYVQNPGFRHDLAGDMAAVFMEYGTLICWSWTGGFVLGSLSRRTIWVNRALFCLALLSVECWGAPRFLGRLLLLPPSYASGPNEGGIFGGILPRCIPVDHTHSLGFVPFALGNASRVPAGHAAITAPNDPLGFGSRDDVRAGGPELSLVAGTHLGHTAPLLAASSIADALGDRGADRVHAR
jgi:hypothetical protein